MHEENSPVRTVSDSKWMRAQLTKFRAFVNPHHMIVVQVRKSLKWINSYQDIPGISLEEEFNPLENLQKHE